MFCDVFITLIADGKEFSIFWFEWNKMSYLSKISSKRRKNINKHFRLTEPIKIVVIRGVDRPSFSCTKPGGL